MSVEKASSISELVPTNPTIQDPVHNGADHFWLLKNVLKKQFPGVSGNGFKTPIAATEDEINHLKGVRADIQTQIDDLAAGASDSAFAKGTAIVFAMPIAPTGWAQVTDPNVDNRMMRVVSTSGGNMAGVDSPIINTVLPAHTHVFTSGSAGGHSHSVTIQNATANHSHSVSISAATIDHTHAFSTNSVDLNHTHHFSGSTGNESDNHTHAGVYTPGGGSNLYPTGATGTNRAGTTSGMSNSHHHDFSGVTGYMDGNQGHAHSGNTGGMSGGTSHTHPGQCQAADANHNHQGSADAVQGHTHSGTTDAAGKDGGWQPRYIDVIIAAKAK